jgi:hypothetical protein
MEIIMVRVSGDEGNDSKEEGDVEIDLFLLLLRNLLRDYYLRVRIVLVLRVGDVKSDE